MASAEPADPDVRDHMDLPPKSFADALAADKPLSESGATSESSDTKVNGESYGGDDYGEPDEEKTVKHKASVLRIVDTHPEDAEETEKMKDNDENKPLIEGKRVERTASKKSNKEAKKEKVEKHEEPKQKPEEEVEIKKPALDRQESKHEYSATVSSLSNWVMENQSLLGTRASMIQQEFLRASSIENKNHPATEAADPRSLMVQSQIQVQPMKRTLSALRSTKILKMALDS